jgi:hypothetical protein
MWWRVRVFGLEVLIGLLVGALGLVQLLFKVPLNTITGDGELVEKVAAALVTIGGTVLISGFFRFFFSLRLEQIEKRILDSLLLGRHAFTRAIENFQPKGYNPRPEERFMACRYLYWKTRDATGKPMWLRFLPVDWHMGVLPFLESHGRIDHPRFGGNFTYHLAMVELQSCLAIAATRMKADGAADAEMAGVYLFTIPVGETATLAGFLRHVNMASGQSLSACVLSTGPVEEAELERIWLSGCGQAKVDRNFPVGDEVMAQPAVA